MIQQPDKNSNNHVSQNNNEDTSSDISPLEKELLDAAGEDDEERALQKAEIDNTDDDGDLLNENTSNDGTTGSELDIPGSEDDDENEVIGEEDEENNGYSVADN